MSARVCAGAVVRFDADDRRAAFEEMAARFVAGEAAGIGGQVAIAALLRAYPHRDWETFRSCLAEDAVIEDRRTPGLLGTLDRDQCAPDSAGEVVRILTWSDRGRVQVARQSGTHDGGKFENLMINVIRTDRDRIQRYEIFDVDAADAALARFAELCSSRRAD